jgi:hypothetical protein
VSASFASRSFRVGAHLCVVVGLAAALFIGLGVSVWLKNGDRAILGIAVGVFGALAVVLATLRLDVTRDGCTARSLFGATTVRFADLARAYFEVTRHESAPQGAASFWVQPRSGAAHKVNLRVYPIEAAALLFRALDAHGVAIDVPDAWAARRMNDQVRAAMRRR